MILGNHIDQETWGRGGDIEEASLYVYAYIHCKYQSILVE